LGTKAPFPAGILEVHWECFARFNEQSFCHRKGGPPLVSFCFDFAFPFPFNRFPSGVVSGSMPKHCLDFGLREGVFKAFEGLENPGVPGFPCHFGDANTSRLAFAAHYLANALYFATLEFETAFQPHNSIAEIRFRPRPGAFSFFTCYFPGQSWRR
jgi:hypothetical protein